MMSRDTDGTESEPSIILSSTDPETGAVRYDGFNPEVLKLVADIPVHRDDVYICGFPKSGNLWTSLIVRAIWMQGNLDALGKRDLRAPATFIDYFIRAAYKRSHPAVFMTHLPYHLLPKGVHQKKVKIINIIRNPKDVAVSYFHFLKIAKLMLHFAKPWNEFFEDFIAGRSPYGDYYDHLRSFWRIRHQPNVMLLHYEDMKENPRQWIAEIAKFLEKPLDNDQLDTIVEATSISNMRKNTNMNPNTLSVFVPGASFLRKGQVGDWRSIFSEKQKERIDQAYRKWCDEKNVPFPDKSRL